MKHGVQKAETSLANSGPGKFVNHAMVNIKDFVQDVGDGFRDAAESTKEFMKHGVQAGENIMDGLGTGAKSLGNMVEYLPWIAIAGVGVYALSTLNNGKRRRIA